jgi:hypothetical protein
MLNIKLIFFLLTCSIATSITAVSLPTIYGLFGVRLVSQPYLNLQLLYSIPLTCTTLIVYGIFYGVNWSSFRHTQQRWQPKRPVFNPKPYKAAKLSQNSDSVAAMRNTLIRRLQGDRAAADRLVSNLKLKNPGKTEEWYWQRAIEQLERDRY